MITRMHTLPLVQDDADTTSEERVVRCDVTDDALAGAAGGGGARRGSVLSRCYLDFVTRANGYCLNDMIQRVDIAVNDVVLESFDGVALKTMGLIDGNQTHPSLRKYPFGTFDPECENNGKVRCDHVSILLNPRHTASELIPLRIGDREQKVSFRITLNPSNCNSRKLVKYALAVESVAIEDDTVREKAAKSLLDRSVLLRSSSKRLIQHQSSSPPSSVVTFRIGGDGGDEFFERTLRCFDTCVDSIFFTLRRPECMDKDDKEVSVFEDFLQGVQVTWSDASGLHEETQSYDSLYLRRAFPRSVYLCYNVPPSASMYAIPFAKSAENLLACMQETPGSGPPPPNYGGCMRPKEIAFRLRNFNYNLWLEVLSWGRTAVSQDGTFTCSLR